MNCKLCEKKLEPYDRGELPPEEKAQVEEHLANCPACAESYRLYRISEQVMEEEKSLTGNPYLMTRIMAKIEDEPQPQVVARRDYLKVFRPALITIVLIIAIMAGILEGRLIQSFTAFRQIPAEVLVLNDSAVESVYAFTNP